MLPDGQALLGEVDQRLACEEGLLAVRAGDGRDQRGLAHGERADPMADRQGHEVEPVVDLLGDTEQHLLRGRMPLVGQCRDRSAMVTVTHIAAEGDHRTGLLIGYEPLEGADVDRPFGDLDQPDGAHPAIIDPSRKTAEATRGDRPVREVLAELHDLRTRGGTAAMATVVRTWQSAPRPAGTSMLVTDAGEAVGSVSGGCVEAALYAIAQEVLASGLPRKVTYGVSDEDALAVGLTCGGTIEVFVERVDELTWPDLEALARAVALDEPVAIATIVSGPAIGRHLVVRSDRTDGTLGTRRLDDTVRADCRGMLAAGLTGFLRYGPEGERLGDGLDVFVTSFAPPAQMFVFGAIDFAAALVRVGKLLGYRVTVCDARPVFATRKRFPEADDVVVDWPHRWLERQQVDARTVIAVLTHDPKFDVPALAAALRTTAGYVGAMGSRRTHEERLILLKEAGLTDDELARLHSPIGLDLGARTPEETAISIAAEIVQVRWGGSGASLATVAGPIHPDGSP